MSGYRVGKKIESAYNFVNITFFFRSLRYVCLSADFHFLRLTDTEKLEKY